jgi:hypothetical protein
MPGSIPSSAWICEKGTSRMGLDTESRPSDSPFIQRVWRSRSSGVDQMMAIASSTWDLVVCEQRGRVEVFVQGPESAAGPAPVPEGATFVGITFSLGTVMPHLPAGRLVDEAVEISGVTRTSFPLKGSHWHLPGYGNAEEFVRRMVREDVLVRDPMVEGVLRGVPPQVSERTVQRRFVAATGLTRGAVRQIDRARRAATLIRDGLPVQEVVHRLGYFDQPHLSRSLARFVGRTATGLSVREPAVPLSLLYKT